MAFSYTGHLPPASQTSLPGGELLLQLLTQQSTEPIGLGSDYVNRATRPDIASMRTGYKENVLPGIQTSAAARGLSRAFVPGVGLDLENRSSQALEQNIAQMLANAYKQQQAALMQERLGGTSGMQNWVGGESALQQARANAEMGMAQAGYTSGLQEKMLKQQKQQQTMSTIGNIAALLAAIPTFGGSLAGTAGGLGSTLAGLGGFGGGASGGAGISSVLAGLPFAV